MVDPSVQLTRKDVLRDLKNEGIVYGIDQLVEGRKLIIGGVEIPFEKGLLGHSDADVLLHAISDALLGAAALGDIGKHFPDTDERYKGADSLKLLEEVGRLLAEKGYTVGNVDATIVAQRPKMAPHIPVMRENIARVLHVDVDRINVKATTEEHLGFTGSISSGTISEQIAAIPMETSEFYGMKSLLADVFESTNNNFAYFQITPSAAMRELSASQDYVLLSQTSDTQKDTIRAPKEGLWDALLNGDLRLFASYRKLTVNRNETSSYSSDVQYIQKLPEKFVSIYRVQEVYLLFAE